jgi:hypothetical protein
MHELVLMFGEVPRLILNQLMSRPRAEATGTNDRSDDDLDQTPDVEQLDTLEGRVRAELSIIEAKMIDLLRDGFLLFADRQFGHSDSHALVRIDPMVEAPYKYISIEANLSIMTPYLGRLIGMNAVVRANLEAKALYDSMLSSAQMRSAMGWVFEGRVHWLLHDGYTLLCREMKNNGTLTIKIKQGKQTFSSLRQLSDRLRLKPNSTKFNADLANIYLRPDRMTLTAIDSLMVVMRNNAPQAVFFQITLNPNHGLKSDGLRAAWKALPAAVTKTDPIVVFLVPHDMAPNYKLQAIQPAKAPFKSWKQYVCGLAEERIWGIKPGRRIVSAPAATTQTLRK